MLSVTLTTFNEEDNLARCLSAIKDIADEIIVVDGSSNDKTVEIAKSFSAKVVVTTNPPVFHINKQKANDLAKGDWVLQLDADEVVSAHLKKEIISLAKGEYCGFDRWLSPLKVRINKSFPFFTKPNKLQEPASAYYLPRRNYFLGGVLMHAGQYPDPVIRLFKKGEAHLPAKDVHEQMVVNGKIGWMVGELNHHATPNFSRYLLRENRYSSLKAQQLYEAGVKVTVFNTLVYLFVKPAVTFFSLYIRYRGFLDGFPGFVFSLYSGFHHAFSYMKLWELYRLSSRT